MQEAYIGCGATCWRETKVVFKSFDVDTVYGVTKGWRETKVVFKCDNFT